MLGRVGVSLDSTKMAFSFIIKRQNQKGKKMTVLDYWLVDLPPSNLALYFKPIEIEYDGSEQVGELDDLSCLMVFSRVVRR